MPTLVQILGCILAILAIVLINGDGSSDTGTAHAGIWLIVLLLAGGFTDSLANIYDKLGNSSLKNHYLLFIFLAAVLLSLVFAFMKKQKFSWTDAFWGILIGIPNYFSARFLLLALADLPAIVTYPVYNIGVILIISLLGYGIFKEKLSRRKSVGILVIVGAIVMLNL